MDAILITGGAGFIGSCFACTWLGTGSGRDGSRTLVNLDKLTYAGHLENLAALSGHPGHHFVRGDIADRPLVGRLLEEYQPRAVVHFAAESHVDRSIDGPAPFLATNVVGTSLLLEAATDYWRGLDAERQARFRFLHVSTDEVYGSLGPTGRFTEQTPYDPHSPYAASKAAGDHLARAWHATYGLPVIVTNCTNNFGPHQYPEKLIPVAVLAAAAGREVPVYGDGLQVRDWIYVEDHVDGLLAALERGRPGQTYNLGAECERSNLELVRSICRLVDRHARAAPRKPTETLIAFVKDRPGHDRRYAIDPAKARRELGWSATTPFDLALEQTVRWYLEHPEWIAAVTKGRYEGERLGLGPTAGATR